MIDKLKGKEKELADSLKKYEEYEVNIIGMILTLRDADDKQDAIIQMQMYLDNPNTPKDRDSMIREAYKIAGIEIPNRK